MAQPLNEFLRSLSTSDFALLGAALKPVSMASADVLAEAGTPLHTIYFPEAGLISVVLELASGDRIETGLVGRTGMLGAAAAFGSMTHINSVMVQMPGSAYVMKATELLEAARRSESLRQALFKQEQFMLVQAQQTAACNAKHQIPQRLSTWLLRVRDISEQEDLSLTQEFLAQMLGVQRASISLVAGTFQEAGIIRYRRGQVRITDVGKLEQTACECYASLRHARLLMSTSKDEEIAATQTE